MDLPELFYLALNLSSILLIISMLLSLRPYIKIAAARAVGILSLVILCWLISAALEILFYDLDPTLVRTFHRLSQSFVIILPMAVIYLVDEFTSQKKTLSRRSYIIIAVFTLGLLILLWTNQYHLLYWKQESFINNTTGIILLTTESSGITIVNTVCEVLLLFSLFHFLHLIIQMGEYYRKMARFAIFAIIIAATITALNLVKPFGSSFDFLPIALVIALFSISRFITRYQIFDLVAISRISYFNSIGDGAIVLDREGRILDVNNSVQTLFHGAKHDDVIGLKVTTLFPDWNDILHEVVNKNHNATITHLTRQLEEDLQFDVSFQPFSNPEGLVSSILVKFQNVTFYTQLLVQLHDLAIRDPLTGVLNRRHFELLSRDHLKLAHRYQRKCSMVIFDLNNFKKLNDTHGHPVGDAALSYFAHLINNQLRESDIFARFGGDEFILFLPETDEKGAIIVLENLWEILQGKTYTIEGVTIQIQTCAGLACAQPESDYDYDDLVYQADQGLYASKEKTACIVGVWKENSPVCLYLDKDHKLQVS